METTHWIYWIHTFSLKSGNLVYLTYSEFFFSSRLLLSFVKQCPICVIIKEMFEICFIKDCSDLHITSVFKVYLVANDLQMINKGSGLHIANTSPGLRYLLDQFPWPQSKRDDSKLSTFSSAVWQWMFKALCSFVDCKSVGNQSCGAAAVCAHVAFSSTPFLEDSNNEILLKLT